MGKYLLGIIYFFYPCAHTCKLLKLILVIALPSSFLEIVLSNELLRLSDLKCFYGAKLKHLKK
jgi:hypothetical protein